MAPVVIENSTSPPDLDGFAYHAYHYFFPCDGETAHGFSKCAPIVASRLVGLAITIGASFLLVPQIVKIFTAKTGKGISVYSQLLALLSHAGVAAYGFEHEFVFSQWGESFFISVQTVIVITQVFYYAGYRTRAAGFLLLSCVPIVLLLLHCVPVVALTFLQAATIPIAIASKGIQIAENLRNKSTGQLSLVSWSMQFVGSSARIFTSVHETGDWLVIASFAVRASLDGVIVGQILFY